MNFCIIILCRWMKPSIYSLAHNFFELQMTVVEAYVGTKNIDPPEDVSQFDETVASLVYEGIAQNTTGSVFPAKVR